MVAQLRQTPKEPTNAEKIRRLPWSIASNAANMIFIRFTFAGAVFVLFLSELGLRKSQIGFLLSFFSYTGLLALIIAPRVARFGYKRTFLIFFGARYGVTALLLLTPWVLSRFGAQMAFGYIASVVAAFSILGAIGNTAAFPWIQEYVPNAVRGKYAATNSIFTTLAGFVAAAGAGYAIEHSSGLDGFMLLIAVGVLFGLITVWAASFIPGGTPVTVTEGRERSYQEMLEAIRDGNFLRYLAGVGAVLLATLPLISFVPLFMQEQVGIRTGNVPLLQMGTLLGGLLSTYLWGWAADRYGSKPVMLSGLSLQTILPIFWLLMPRNSLWSFSIALSIAFLQGIAEVSWAIGSGRLLYVSIVPPEKKTAYLALYYAWIGLVGGSSQLLGGQILEYSQQIKGQFFIFHLDPYTSIFVLGFILPVVGIVLLGLVRADNVFTVREFAGMFFRGNPLLAMESLIRYHLARDERAAVSMTERLGQTKSPLTVDELLEALADPRFNVRFEAIIAIARRKPDPRLSKALQKTLHGNQPALGVVAAWALGRMGDERALRSLREGLNSRYRSIKDHCARALGTMGDQQVVPLLLTRLASEPDQGLQLAYASALGKLEAQEATSTLLALLRKSQEEDAQLELALALARIVGEERHFIQLLRRTRTEAGTATAQATASLRKKIGKGGLRSKDLSALLNNCEEALAREAMEEGARLMRDLIFRLPVERFTEANLMILRDCADYLGEFGPERLEYLLLALHTMNVGWQS